MSGASISKLPTRTVSSLEPVSRLEPRSATWTWTEITARAEQLASTMKNYLAQLAISSRPATVEAADLALRVFAGHLIETDPDCVCVADVSRHHVESFKLALAARPGKSPGQPAAVATICHKLGLVRTFFERIIEWDYDDAAPKGPHLRRGLPQTGRAPAPISGRPHRRQVHGRLGRRPRPASATHGRTAGPHRHAGRRARRSARRCRVPHEWCPLAADPGREAPQRPQRSPPPGAHRPHRRLPGPARSESLSDCWSSATTANPSTVGPSTATWPRWHGGRAPATSTHTSCATPSPPS